MHIYIYVVGRVKEGCFLWVECGLPEREDRKAKERIEKRKKKKLLFCSVLCSSSSFLFSGFLFLLSAAAEMKNRNPTFRAPPTNTPPSVEHK